MYNVLLEKKVELLLKRTILCVQDNTNSKTHPSHQLNYVKWLGHPFLSSIIIVNNSFSCGKY